MDNLKKVKCEYLMSTDLFLDPNSFDSQEELQRKCTLELNKLTHDLPNTGLQEVVNVRLINY